jgi:hypothetical protein
MPNYLAVTAAGDPPRFLSLRESIPKELRDGDALYGGFGRSYYPAVFGARLEDCSFGLVTPSGECVLVECDALDGTLGRFGMPIRIVWTCAESGTLRSLLRGAVKMLVRVAAQTSAHTVVIADPGSRELLGELGLACMALGGSIRVRVHAVVDLSRSTDELRADVRKSVKSLLNWGRRSLELRYCNSGDIDSESFDAYRRLHARVAGRVTRGQDSWRVMFETVQCGHGELVTVYLDGELVGGLLVVDGARSSHYASGASIRERFDLPLAHWPLMDAIMRAKLRGMRWFDIGELVVPGEATAKEVSISFFKKALTSRVEIRPEWRLAVAGDDSA